MISVRDKSSIISRSQKCFIPFQITLKIVELYELGPYFFQDHGKFLIVIIRSVHYSD